MITRKKKKEESHSIGAKQKNLQRMTEPSHSRASCKHCAKYFHPLPSQTLLSPRCGTSRNLSLTCTETERSRVQTNDTLSQNISSLKDVVDPAKLA